jgi:hypothetical protein
MRSILSILVLAAISGASSIRAESPASIAERFLIEGKLAEGERALADLVKAHPDDPEAQFGLGATQFLRAVERMVQSFHRYGLHSGMIGELLPFARLPIPANTRPEPIRYNDLRAIIHIWNDDLAKAEATLGRAGEKEVKLPLHFGQIRLDLNGDGRASPEETLWKLYVQLNAPARNQATAEASQQFVIAFDRGDVAWLRGYCHLLMAMSEAFLAYDAQELFDHTASMFYPRAETPFPFLRRGPVADGKIPAGNEPRGRGAEARGEDPYSEEDMLDAVAFIHELRLPIKEPERMKAVLGPLEAMLALSRESWKFILAETDDDHEWVPNPKQHSAMPGGTVTAAMVEGWMEFLNEAEALLKGEKLVPFWRRREARGVNLRRVFTEPRMFDLVLWVQGTAAAPYLENGPQTKPETWRRFQNLFQGQFIGFAIWFN